MRAVVNHRVVVVPRTVTHNQTPTMSRNEKINAQICTLRIEDLISQYFIYQNSIFLYFLWPISIFSSFSKALYRLPGFDIEPRPSLGPSQKIEPEPSKNGRPQAKPKPSLGLDPSLVTQGSKQYLGIKEYQERI